MCEMVRERENVVIVREKERWYMRVEDKETMHSGTEIEGEKERMCTCLCLKRLTNTRIKRV